MAGVMAVGYSIYSTGEQYDRMNALIRANSRAMNEIKDREAEWQRTIENISSMRNLDDVGALTEDQSRAALEDAKAIMRRFEQLEPDVVIYTVGMLAGTGVDREEMINAAILIQAGKLDLSDAVGGRSVREVVQWASGRNAVFKRN